MAKPTAPTEFGGTKTMFGVDSAGTTPNVYGVAAVETAATAESTYPASWWGFATHQQGDTLTAPGGFTVDGAGPVILGAGLDGTTVRALAVDSSGNLQVDILNSTIAVTQSGTWNLTNISGTISLPTGAATEATLASLDASLTSVIDGAGSALDVDVLTVPAPLSTTGGGTEATALRVTLASDSTGLVSVDDNGGSLTVDAPLAIPVNVQVGDGTNTATIRNLASNDALNVAIVDGSGNQVTSFGGSGGTSATDDSAFTAASGSGTPIMGFATSDTVDAGDVGVLAMDVNRNLKVSIEVDNAGIGGGTQYDEGDTASPITGTAILWEDAGNTLATVSAASPLPVEIIAGASGIATETTLASVLSELQSVTYAEDSSHVTTDPGIQLLGVVNSTNADFVDADGDYCPIAVSTSGNVFTDIRVNEAWKIVNDTYTAGSTKGEPAIAVRNDSGATTLTAADGRYSPIAVDDKGRIGISDLGGSITVDGTVAVSAVGGTVAVTQSGTWNLTNISGTISLPTGAATEATLASLDAALASVIDGAGSAIDVNASVSTSVPDSDPVDAAISVTTSATALPTTAATGRRKINIQNLGTVDVFVGGASVTTSSGTKIFASGGSANFELGDGAVLYGIVASGSADVRVLEFPA